MLTRSCARCYQSSPLSMVGEINSHHSQCDWADFGKDELDRAYLGICRRYCPEDGTKIDAEYVKRQVTWNVNNLRTVTNRILSLRQHRSRSWSCWQSLLVLDRGKSRAAPRAYRLAQRAPSRGRSQLSHPQLRVRLTIHAECAKERYFELRPRTAPGSVQRPIRHWCTATAHCLYLSLSWWNSRQRGKLDVYPF